jgi:hypothetical protein
VAVYRLFHAVEHRLRQKFDHLVPISLRKTLWHELLHLPQTAYTPSDDSADLRDETRGLLVGGVLPVSLTKLNGRWTITHIGNRPR